MAQIHSFILNCTRGGLTRSQILETLAVEPHTVGELATILDVDRNTLREHLTVLETNDMVDTHIRPNAISYAVAEGIPRLEI